MRFAEAHMQAKEEEGVLGSVKGWFGGVGEMAKKAEADAWKWAQGRRGSRFE
jgi:hypothetical protein